MQRHRQLQVGIAEQLGAGALHPLRQWWSEVQPVAVLQCEDERAAGIVITQRRPCAIELRRRGEAGAAETSGTEIEIEGIAATGAARRAEEGEPTPATGAQRARRGNRRAASETARRQHQVE